jgi:hypothetical protein
MQECQQIKAGKHPYKASKVSDRATDNSRSKIGNIFVKITDDNTLITDREKL